MTPSRADLIEAHERIVPFIHRTPVMSSRAIDDMVGAEIFFKCENFQKTGSFKIRGATHAVSRLTQEERQRGVATHSSGNHAQALALASKLHGVHATIVMPENSNPIKRLSTLGYGATVVDCGPTATSRQSVLDEVVRESGAIFIPPFNDDRIIAGQGTAARELFEDVERLAVVLAPVGGGGLLSGTALAAHHFSPGTRVMGAEPEEADDAYRSLESGVKQPMEQTATIADGLRTALGDRTFPIIREHVAAIITVSETEIVEAMRLVWERMKIVIEPSAAVPVAALLKRPEAFQGMRVGVILSGGNVDLDALPFR